MSKEECNKCASVLPHWIDRFPRILPYSTRHNIQRRKERPSSLMQIIHGNVLINLHQKKILHEGRNQTLLRFRNGKILSPHMQYPDVTFRQRHSSSRRRRVGRLLPREDPSLDSRIKLLVYRTRNLCPNRLCVSC